MHNTDRTQLEFEGDSEAYELESASEAAPCKCHSRPREALSEAEEMELATELLEISDESELDQFLGKFIKQIGRKVGKFVRSPIGGALLKALKGAALTAVPGLGPVVGAATALGAAVKSVSPAEEPTPEAASEIFGLELEGLSPEGQEFEVARRFVRFGAEAVAQATKADPAVPPEHATSQAVNRAAERHAPGLGRQQSRSGARGMRHPGRSGRWERRGRHIILFNV